jgi:hypothetical protein
MSFVSPEAVDRARRHLRNENHRWPAHLVKVPRASWPECMPARLFEVWRSSGFLVQVFREPDDVVRLSIMTTWVDDAGRSQDGISWDDLQRLKRECGFGDRDAVEVFPSDRDVVNVANMRHLWVLSSPLTFKWCALRAAKEDGR